MEEYRKRQQENWRRNRGQQPSLNRTNQAPDSPQQSTQNPSRQVPLNQHVLPRPQTTPKRSQPPQQQSSSSNQQQSNPSHEEQLKRDEELARALQEQYDQESEILARAAFDRGNLNQQISQEQTNLSPLPTPATAAPTFPTAIPQTQQQSQNQQTQQSQRGGVLNTISNWFSNLFAAHPHEQQTQQPQQSTSQPPIVRQIPRTRAQQQHIQQSRTQAPPTTSGSSYTYQYSDNPFETIRRSQMSGMDPLEQLIHLYSNMLQGNTTTPGIGNTLEEEDNEDYDEDDSVTTFNLPFGGTLMVSSYSSGSGGASGTPRRRRRMSIDPYELFGQNISGDSYEALSQLAERLGHVNRGASKEQIEESSNRFVIKDKKQIPEENSNCCICMDDFEVGKEVRRLPCLHMFCSGCVDKWLEQNKHCPMCRHAIDEPISQS